MVIAHLLLTHLAITKPSAQADDKAGPIDLGSIPQRQQMLRSKIWDDTINTMEAGSQNRRVGKKLKELIMLAS